MASAVLKFLVNCGASILGNAATSAVKEIMRAVKPESLESLFVDAFLKSLDDHDKGHDETAKKHLAVLKKAVKEDRDKLLGIFGRNSDDLQTFLTPIRKQKFQREVAGEIVREFSLGAQEPDGLILAIVTDCLGRYEECFRQQMTEHQALQVILTKILRIDSKLDQQLSSRVPDSAGTDTEDRLKVDVSKLPPTSSLLLGRERELQWLDGAWESDTTHIFSLVAWGGVGKTALVNYWLTHKTAPNYGGAERVYGWSFYSQGTREAAQASSDIFLVEALKWFGDAETAASKKGPWDKGLRLAELVQQHKTLLILDGVEPLQYPPGPMQGRLKDQGLQALLKQLAAANNGLCVITTRQKIDDIEQHEGSTLKRVPLENLSNEAGRHVLREMGVHRGTDGELEEAAEEFRGHALALSLLGSYLATVHDGEIRKRDLIGQLTEEEEKGGHAKRVMESYEIWLKDTAELDILYLMGLFDRPAPGGAIDALKAEPAIKGLTEKLQDLSDAKWKYAVKRLRDLRLLGRKDESDPDMLDCHPLVREYFGQKLQEGNGAAWRQAHKRLYEYYKGVPKKELPHTLEEMQPLFAAVAHGCQAGMHQEALDDVYWDRICRKDDAYVNRQLGAFGSDLSAVAGFFDILWSTPGSGLKEEDKAWVLNSAAFALRPVGRLREAAQPMQASLDRLVQAEDWERAGHAAVNLSELYLTLGEIKKAVDSAEISVEYADRSGKHFERKVTRARLADARHQSGRAAESERLFGEAETIQKHDQAGRPILYSLSGFQFCDLLLSEGRYREVQKRFHKLLECRVSSDSLLDIALENLSGGRAYMLQADEERSGDFAQAADYLDQAVEGLRKAGTQDHLPRGLLARAGLYLLEGDFARGWGDLAEVKEIAERGEMRLHLADYHLEAGRVCLAQGDKEEARGHLEKAETLVNETGYHRRDGEVEELAAVVREA